uniref:Uncharacterized protein n=1 Tax=Romanomermis culicivorax TaxID=13658 RepID=A0A915IMG5_ROMCU
MKEIAFNTRTNLNFPHVCNCLSIADVDGDGVHEVIAGSRDGHLAIFKPNSEEIFNENGLSPYKTASKLGLVSALAVGDLFNRNCPLVTVISADGACHVFRATSPKSELQLCLLQPLQSNIRAAQIVDVDGDFYHELVVGLTDRVMYAPIFTYMTDNDHASNDNNWPSGYLIALNKWESPTLITAFSQMFVSPENRNNGVRIILSQTSQKFVVLEPKLGTDLEMAGDSSTVDRSVRYCQAKKSSGVQARRGSASKDVDANFVAQDKSTIFMARNADYVCMFHQPAKRIFLVNDSCEVESVDHALNLPSMAFSISCLVVPNGYSSVNEPSHDTTSLEFDDPKDDANEKPSSKKRAFMACDTSGNLSIFDVENRAPSTSTIDDNFLSLKISDGNLNCFAAALGHTELQEYTLRCIVAVSTTRSRLFCYTTPWTKISKFLQPPTKT